MANEKRGIEKPGIILSFDVVSRDHNGPVCIASPAGGVDIEEVASSTPEKIKTVQIPIIEGLSLTVAKEIATFLEFKGPGIEQVLSNYFISSSI